MHSRKVIELFQNDKKDHVYLGYGESAEELRIPPRTRTNALALILRKGIWSFPANEVYHPVPWMEGRNQHLYRSLPDPGGDAHVKFIPTESEPQTSKQKKNEQKDIKMFFQLSSSSCDGRTTRRVVVIDEQHTTPAPVSSSAGAAESMHITYQYFMNRLNVIG